MRPLDNDGSYGYNFRGADLRKLDLRREYYDEADFEDADLRGADLRGAKFRGANFKNAKMAGAKLRGAVLSEADFSGATGLPKAPKIKDIDKAILSRVKARKGGLRMNSWHTCKTTHCRAGWAVALAGKKGKELEKKLGVCAAGALIYAKSRPTEAVPDFFNMDEMDVLRDMGDRTPGKTWDRMVEPGGIPYDKKWKPTGSSGLPGADRF